MDPGDFWKGQTCHWNNHALVSSIDLRSLASDNPHFPYTSAALPLLLPPPLDDDVLTASVILKLWICVTVTVSVIEYVSWKRRWCCREGSNMMSTIE